MEREHPVVSVIMLVHNQEDYVAQAIESVLAQKVPFPYEILVGDDASQDGTKKIVGEYRSRYPDRIRVFRHESNVGAAANAAGLLMEARGRYLAFCEGDDYWTDPQKLSRQVAFLDSHPEYVGCTHRCLLVDEHGVPHRKQRLSWVKNKPRFTFRDFSGGRYLPGQTATVVKRNIFLKQSDSYAFMYTANRNVSDRMATEVYLLIGDFACLPQSMSAYRIPCSPSHGGITVAQFQKNEKRCEDELEMTRALEQYAEKVLSRRVVFVKKRCDILRDALMQWMCRPSRERWGRLADVSSMGEMPWWGYLWLPMSFWKKFMDKVTAK